MEPGFRAAMNWLHTWAGVVVGALLFAIFWMGTLSVFDREIDRWMMPQTRTLVAPADTDLDALWKAAPPRPGASQWSVNLPFDRVPMARLRERGPDGKFRQAWLDPVSGARLPEPGTLGASRFLYPFHYNLHLKVWDMGQWLVGFAAMAMLAMLVSGVVVHRKIFTDFFVLRPDRKPRRLLLDLHTVGGVLALPFHFAITLSGLILFAAIYFPSVQRIANEGARTNLAREAQGLDVYARPKANRPGESLPLGIFVAQAREAWGVDPFFVRVWHPGDANAYVELRRSFTAEVKLNRDALYFDAVTGRLLSSFTTQPVATAQRFISGLHSIHFRHWPLRWLYFILGLVGCAMIATGLLYWIEGRRRRHVAEGSAGVRIVEGLTIGATAGIVTATLAFFVANRALPPELLDRESIEVWVFYGVWLATVAHAWARPRRAWIEQCWALAVLSLAAVVLNALTTGDHLLRSLADGLWPVAAMDGLLLAGAAVAASTALWLRHRSNPGEPGIRRAWKSGQVAGGPGFQSRVLVDPSDDRATGVARAQQPDRIAP
jgi:uncharacterized iron-regulated membrane protein